MTIAEPSAANSTSSSQTSYETARSISPPDPSDLDIALPEIETDSGSSAARSRVSTQDSLATVIKRIRHRNLINTGTFHSAIFGEVN